MCDDVAHVMTWQVRAMRALELRYQAAAREESVQRFNLEVCMQTISRSRSHATHHLDLPGIKWLVKYLTKTYKGTVLCVSHDRSFINSVR